MFRLRDFKYFGGELIAIIIIIAFVLFLISLSPAWRIN